MSAVRQHLPGEREMYIEARFGGLEVIVGDEHGDILSADMTGNVCVCEILHVHACTCICVLIHVCYVM